MGPSMTAEQDQARAEVRAATERRLADAQQRLDFGVRNGFSQGKIAEYEAALAKAEAALWPWQEMDRMKEIFTRYWEAAQTTE